MIRRRSLDLDIEEIKNRPVFAASELKIYAACQQNQPFDEDC